MQPTHAVTDTIREQLTQYAKDFKTSWISLGRHLHAAWEDKLFYSWGFEKFEHYTQKELGLNKQFSLKLLKTYVFLEEDEPAYLKDEFKDERDAVKVPGVDEINVLRLARSKKELFSDDYKQLKNVVFEKGKDARTARRELTAMMKERKVVDPDEEREQRSAAAVQRLITSLRSFEKDMNTLKLIPADIIDEAKELLNKLKQQAG